MYPKEPLKGNRCEFTFKVSYEYWDRGSMTWYLNPNKLENIPLTLVCD